MNDVYVCPRCGEAMRVMRIACWLRLLAPAHQGEASAPDDQIHFFCRNCSLPLTYPRDTPLAAA